MLFTIAAISFRGYHKVLERLEALNAGLTALG